MIPVKLYVYAGALLAIALCLLGGGWYAYSHGEKSQAAKDAQTIEQLTEARNAAIAQVADSAKALDQVNANTRLEQLNAAVQKGQVEAAIEQLGKERQSAQADAVAWKAKFDKASATPACLSVLKEELCEAISGY